MRTNTETEKLIYQNEYEQLPQAVKDHYVEASALIKLANKADSAERIAAAEYKLVHEKVSDENGDAYTRLRDRIALINEAEAIAGKIVESQTFWKYEGVPVPGNGDKIPMNSNTLQKIVKGVEGISKDLEEANFEANVAGLQQEIIKAKEYLHTLKRALVVYNNISTVQIAIYEAEASITIYERVVARRIREAER